MSRPETGRQDEAARPLRLELEAFLPYRLSVLSNLVSSAIAGAYSQAFGLSIPEWRVVAILARFPGSSATAIAERAAMDKVQVSRAVRSLCAADRIEREANAADRRSSYLRLTEAGWRIYERIVPLARAYEEDLVAVLSPRERQQLDELLAKLQSKAETWHR